MGFFSGNGDIAFANYFTAAITHYLAAIAVYGISLSKNETLTPRNRRVIRYLAISTGGFALHQTWWGIWRYWLPSDLSAWLVSHASWTSITYLMIIGGVVGAVVEIRHANAGLKEYSLWCSAFVLLWILGLYFTI